MIPLAWSEIEALGLGELRGAPADRVVRRVHDDSRDARPGDLFVALNTGVGYVEDALAAGAGHPRPARPGRGARRARAPRPRPVERPGRRGGRLDREDDDEGRARGTVRRGHADRRRSREQEQRARSPAHRSPPRTGDTGARHRDGHAGARTDRGALRGRATDTRARDVDRAGAPRARGGRRRRRPRERRGGRGAARGRDRRGPRRRAAPRAVSRRRGRRPPLRPRIRPSGTATRGCFRSAAARFGSSCRSRSATSRRTSSPR